jgi:Group II intron, maturase-specific domain
MKRNVGEYLRPSNNRPWDEVRNRLNQKLRGWKGYFNVGSAARAYRAIDEYVEERVRHFLRRRHKAPTQGTREFSMKRIFGELGVTGFADRWVTPVRESATKPAGKPDAGNPHVRFDERGWEPGRRTMRQHPRPSSTLPPVFSWTLRQSSRSGK